MTAALLCNLHRLRARKSFLAMGAVLLLAPWVTGLALKGARLDVAVRRATESRGNAGQRRTKHEVGPAKLNDQLALYRDMTFRSQQADLIVWPETAVPVLKESAEGYLSMMGKFASDRGAALITGVPVREPTGRGEYRYYNGITVTGQGDGTYYKQKLVPFGEYVPLQDLLRGLISFFDLPMSDFARGPNDQALLQAKGYHIAPFICYEVVYPEFAAGLSAQSDLLLTVSNDTGSAPRSALCNTCRWPKCARLKRVAG